MLYYLTSIPCAPRRFTFGLTLLLQAGTLSATFISDLRIRIRIQGQGESPLNSSPSNRRIALRSIMHDVGRSKSDFSVQHGQARGCPPAQSTLCDSTITNHGSLQNHVLRGIAHVQCFVIPPSYRVGCLF